MTSRRHHRVSLRSVVWAVLAIGLMAVVSVAEAILRHPLGQVAAVTLLPVGAYLLGRRRGRRAAPYDRARLRDENTKLRAKVRTLSDMINGPEARR